MKKTIITTVFVTALVIVFAFHAYEVYSLKGQLAQVETIVAQDHGTLAQIVGLINQNQPQAPVK